MFVGRFAFSFLYEGEEAVAAEQDSEGFLQRLFQRVRKSKSIARTGLEFDQRDLRVLNGLDSLLKKAKVVNN